MSLDAILESLEEHREIGPGVAHRVYLPAIESRFGELERPLPQALLQALAERGSEQLWSHQVEALDALRRDEDILVTTPTASGKSLVFQLPILEEALRGGDGKALFLFPLKALGQDQRSKLDELAHAVGIEDICAIYDGDTSQHFRAKIRKNPPRVIITNPDMLHLGLLGHPAGWRDFFANLRWLVLDELHTYRGIFGSHFHHVLQRLLRLTRDAGAEPRIIAASATASNAAEFAATLCDRPFKWIHDSGAPREGRHVVMLKPESSPYTLTLNLFRFCLKRGLKTIVFTKARRITELLYSWLRRRDPKLAARVKSYRAGFLPSERRQIEQDLSEGRLDGVISTSALEMGIDIGGLDACILVGYPGSVMATWQRSGRVGRRGRESLTALIAMPDALDQYLLDHPEVVLDSPCERLATDPSNEQVAGPHLVCAATELALRRNEDRAYLERHAALIGDLLRKGELAETADGREICSRIRNPHRRISLRGSGSTYSIVDETSGKVIGTVDGMRALQECHEGAIYLHAGRQYAIRSLDLDERKAVARATRVEYFTTPLTEKETEILEILDQSSQGPLHACLGRLEVTERVVGYERRNLAGREVLGRHDLDLPPMQFQTVGLWFAAPREVEEKLRETEAHFMGALHAAEHATIALLPLLALCDRNDIGGISIPFHPQVGSGAVFVYDGHPGGVGLAARGFEELKDLLSRVADLLERCPCEEGCPSCVHSPKCGNGNRPLDKGGALDLLRLLLERKELGVLAPRPVPVEPLGKREVIAPKSQAMESPPASEEIVDPPEKVVDKKKMAAPRKRRSEAKKPASDRELTALFDLETLRSAKDVGGWDKAHKMGVAVGVVCLLEEDRFEVYREQGVRDLVEDLRGADLVIGFNINRFDYKVLQGYIGEDLSRTLPTLDLLDDIYGRLGYRIGLDHLAKETLGASKSADGLQSLEWVKEGRFDLVEEYCRHDVAILRDLYLFGRREGHVFYKDRQGRRLKLSVDW